MSLNEQPYGAPMQIPLGLSGRVIEIGVLGFRMQIAGRPIPCRRSADNATSERD